MNDSIAFDAIADDSRRKILDTLRDQGPLRASDLVACFPQMSQPAVSKHLRILRAARLVQAEQNGRERIYRLNPGALRQIVDWLRCYEPLWDERLMKLKALAEQHSQEGNQP